MRFVLIGCGNICNSRHIPALRALGANVFGVIGLDPFKVQQAAKSSKAQHHWCGDIGIGATPDWLREGDVYVISTPPRSHLSTVEAIVALKPKAVVILEKPLCASVEEIGRFQTLIDQGLKLTLMHNFLFTSGVLRIREWLRNGRLGDIESIQFFQWSTEDRRLPNWRNSLDGGLFWDESPHFFYLAQHFLGPLSVENSFVVDSADSTPKLVDAVLSNSSGAIAQLNMRFHAAISEWGFVMTCSNGTVIYDMFRDIVHFLKRDGLHLPGDILRTSMSSSRQHLSGVLNSGFQVLRGRLHFGVDAVFKQVINGTVTPETRFEMAKRTILLMGEVLATGNRTS